MPYRWMVVWQFSDGTERTFGPMPGRDVKFLDDIAKRRSKELALSSWYHLEFAKWLDVKRSNEYANKHGDAESGG